MALDAKKLKVLRGEPLGDRPNRVARAIELADVKQGDVAVALGWTQPYLSNVCRGRFETITVENAHKLAEYFGCAIEDLFPAKQEVA